jgi:aconitate hydratase
VSSVINPAATRATLLAGGRSYRYYSLRAAERAGLNGVSRLPWTLKIVLENVLRQCAVGNGRVEDTATLMTWLTGARRTAHVHLRPARVMMDDTAGLPLIGELAAMREATREMGLSEATVDLAVPLDFIVDHSVIADHTGSPDALARNMELEMRRNAERYRLLKWAGQAFARLRIVPPGRGICHQINLEHLAQVVCSVEEQDGSTAFFDTLVGIDSHTPMVNGLGVLAWGTSGMEGLAAALGAPVAFALPEVVGCRLTGALRPGVTATDLVLTLTQKLRAHGVVGKVIEYSGAGVTALTVPDRATVANMTPEAGATMSYFPVDGLTLDYLRATGRTAEHVALVEAYAKAQGLWFADDAAPAEYDEVITVVLDEIEPSMSGPHLPHERVSLAGVAQGFAACARRSDEHEELRDGDVVIAAITSCTNTSNPALMVGAGLLARNAVRRGLKAKPWVRTSLSPGSRVVADYLEAAGLQSALDALGFHVVGFGCMTCVGFSGSLDERVVRAVRERGLRAAAVFSGNRNYEGRVHPVISESFLASPPLVVAHVLSGTVARDLTSEPVGEDARGEPVFLRDLWPDPREVQEVIERLGAEFFTRSYADLHAGSEAWRALDAPRGPFFEWEPGSTFIQRPQTYAHCARPAHTMDDLRGARILAMYGDMVTTEHISPMGVIPEDSPAAQYLRDAGVEPRNFVSYAARRLNQEVMVRGTFSVRYLKNELLPDAPGGLTRHMPDRALMPIHEAAQRYRAQRVPMVVIAGRSLGTGSSRDWSAKGPAALGVRAMIAESYERIYRSNLVAAGVLPLEFCPGTTRKSLRLDGTETIEIEGLDAALAPRGRLTARFTRATGDALDVPLIACVETADEVEVLRGGGLLVTLLRRLTAN